MCVHERICYLENDNIGRRDLKWLFRKWSAGVGGGYRRQEVVSVS
jgi:hypothetical protein